MSKFKYTGFTRDGKKVESTVEADTVKDAKKILRRRNIRPTKVLTPSIFETDLGEFMARRVF